MYGYLAFFAQSDAGSCQVVDGTRGIETGVRVVGSKADVGGIPAFCRGREGFVVGLLAQVDVGRVEGDVQHAGLEADAQLSLADFQLIGILPPETLVAEQADGFIEETHAGALRLVEQREREVGTEIHHARGVGEAHQLHAVRTVDIQLVLRLPCPCGMIIARHRPVLAKACVELRPYSCRTAEEEAHPDCRFQDKTVSHHYKN